DVARHSLDFASSRLRTQPCPSIAPAARRPTSTSRRGIDRRHKIRAADQAARSALPRGTCRPADRARWPRSAHAMRSRRHQKSAGREAMPDWRHLACGLQCCWSRRSQPFPATFSAPVPIFPHPILVRSMLSEAQIGKDIGDAHLRGAILLVQRQAEDVFEHLNDARIFALAEPLGDRCLPAIGLDARRLLGSSERFQLRRFQPPFLAGLKTHDGFRPQLIAITLNRVMLNHTMTGKWPNTPRASRIFEVTARR